MSRRRPGVIEAAALLGALALTSACASRPATPAAPAASLAFALEVRVEAWGEDDPFLDLPRVPAHPGLEGLEEWLEAGTLRTEALPPREDDPYLRPLRVRPGEAAESGEWVGRLRYAARLPARDAPLPPVLEGWPEADPGLSRWLRPTTALPARSPRVRKFLVSRVEPRLEAGAPDVVREIVAVLDEAVRLDREKASGPGVLEALRTGVTTPNGLNRLLVTSLRTAGIPARLAAGLDLAAPKGERFVRWTEVHLQGAWWALAPPGMSALPGSVIELDHGDQRFLPRSEGTRLRFVLLPLVVPPGDAIGEAATRALDASARRRAAREQEEERE
ncbi:MAG: transglutaminase domain-containing protein [Deltaproteobacteria bacterium]|nr:transglutaminase domain-containing protein [Deltaproteobacteria bacterium]